MRKCKTIAVCNQKGGVGKTTTTVNLGVALVMLGKKVLLVDADPQGDLTTCLGFNGDTLEETLFNKMYGIALGNKSEPFKGILHHKEGVDLVPSSSEMFDLETSLVTAMNREVILRKYLDEVKGEYDYIIIDSTPSLGMMNLNALSAADSVIIPVQAQYLPAKCMTQLLRTVGRVREHINPKLQIEGILLTIVDRRTIILSLVGVVPVVWLPCLQQPYIHMMALSIMSLPVPKKRKISIIIFLSVRNFLSMIQV